MGQYIQENSKRKIQLYLQHLVEYNDKEKILFAPLPKSENHNSIANFINYFCNKKKFNILLYLMKTYIVYEKATPQQGQKTIQKSYHINLKMANLIMHIIEEQIPNFTKQFAKDIIFSFNTDLINLINQLPISDLKTSECTQAFDLIHSSTSGINISQFQQKSEAAEQKELTLINFAIKVLKCPYLQSKIKAINEIKAFIKLISANASGIKFFKSTEYYFTSSKLQNYLNDNQVIDIILGEYFHIEVLKRSAECLEFMLSNNPNATKYLGILWDKQQNKHDQNTKIVYEVIEELAQKLSQECLEFLFRRISKIPQEKCDELTINFLYNFSFHARNSILSQQS
eukprot:TRINITY_DN5284_c0_g1_i1.p2 TRINITY_DN5284_c0_g1~~TRINITY_DN5284_c0_g1_i1.p2  ORF type:complete len:342 (+),score=59.01 TRINITY_DN5284_c0_g1_i1:762-1787(+)